MLHLSKAALCQFEMVKAMSRLFDSDEAGCMDDEAAECALQGPLV